MWLHLEEEVRSVPVSAHRRRLRLRATAVLEQVARQPVGEDMMLLRPLLGYERLKRFPEEHLVPPRSRTHDIEEKVGACHYRIARRGG
jgi:hypothetical protein